MLYRKKPIEIEAFQMTEAARIDGVGWPVWLDDAAYKSKDKPGSLWKEQGGKIYLNTLEGDLQVSEDDWIIRGIQGELYPCKPDIFAATYDPVH